ncbi:MAG TPA: amidohydrolase family protein [Acidimicrobiia bacterium]|nr:amidohydrolase family protein [Acidimicrobiia bacterium]
MRQPTTLAIRPVGGDPLFLQVDAGCWVTPATTTSAAYDLTGFFALPGLADCHAHLAADSLQQVDQGGEIGAIARRAFTQLATGVLLVIDKGWRDEVVLQLLDRPPEERPHLEAAGRIITGDQGYFPGFAVEVDNAGLVEAVRAANPKGGWVKVIGDWPQKGRGPVISFSEESLTAACAVAHAAGVKVAIHTMAPDTPGMAVRAGVDSIEHGLYLTEEDVRMLGARGGAWVPTVANTEDVIANLGPGSSGARILGAGLENVRIRLRPAVESGVTVLAGTDLGLAHGEVAREAALLHEYGLTGPQAVEAAGPAAYRYLGIRFFEPGSGADLVLFGEDPTEDVTALQRPVAAMRAGRVVFDRVGLGGG